MMWCRSMDVAWSCLCINIDSEVTRCRRVCVDRRSLFYNHRDCTTTWVVSCTKMQYHQVHQLWQSGAGNIRRGWHETGAGRFCLCNRVTEGALVGDEVRAARFVRSPSMALCGLLSFCHCDCATLLCIQHVFSFIPIHDFVLCESSMNIKRKPTHTCTIYTCTYIHI